MASERDPFFSTRQGAAVLKHGVLRHYLPKFVGMTGSTSQDKRVCYVDLFAGVDEYEDGTASSALFAADMADNLKDLRDVDGFLVEKNPAHHALLAAAINSVRPDWVVRCADAGRVLDEVLEWADGSPLFALIDPYGLNFGIDDVARIMNRAGHSPTEVLINVSRVAINRRCGALTSTSNDETYVTKTRPSVIRNLDTMLGGSWWHDLWRQAPTDEREQAVVDGYRQQLQDRVGCSWCALPVADRPGDRPVYDLLLATRHPQGLWQFNEAVVKSTESFRAWHDAQAPDDGQIAFDFGSPTPDLVGRIEENLAAMLATGPTGQLAKRTLEVYEGVLGYARETDVRKAVKNLHTAGRTSHDGKGSPISKFNLQPPPD